MIVPQNSCETLRFSGKWGIYQCYFKRTEAFHLTEAATNKKRRFLHSETIFRNTGLLALWLAIVAVINFDVLKSADLLNTAVIQNSSCKRPLLCSKVLYALINLEAEFGAGA